MKEQIVQYETSKLLKEIGFNYPVINQYIGDKLYLGKDFTLCDPIDVNSDAKDRDVYSAPTQSLAQKFLREKYGIQIVQITEHLETKIRPYTYKLNGYEFQIHKIEYDQGDIKYTGVYNTYEQALEKGLQEAIKIIKDE